MKNKVLIIIYPYKFTNFTWSLYDLREIEDHADVIVLDLFNYLYGKEKNWKCNNCTNKVHYIFSVYELILYTTKIKNMTIEQKIFIWNSIQNNSFKEILCNLVLFFLLKKCKIKSFDMYNGGVVLRDNKARSHRSAVSIISRVFSYDSSSQIWKAANRFFFRYLALKIPTINTHSFVSGSEWEKLAKEDSLGKKTIVYGHSYDYSKYIRSKKNNYPVKANTAVFLSDSGLLSQNTDSAYIGGGKYSRSSKVWFSALNDFFLFLERETKVSIQIAGHYKTNYLEIEPLFDNRRVYYNQTLDLIYQCEYVIAINSTAVSYAVALKKPILFIYSNELEREKLTMASIKKMSYRLGAKLINIDKSFQGLNIECCLIVDCDKYDDYKYSALTSKDSCYTNSEIILQEIMGVRIV